MQINLLPGRIADTVVGNARVFSGVRTGHSDHLQRSVSQDLVSTLVMDNLDKYQHHLGLRLG